MNFPGAIWAARLILLAAVLFLISLLIMGGLAFGYPAPKLDRPTPPPTIQVGDVVEHIGTHDMLIVHKYVPPDEAGVFLNGYYWLMTHPGKGWLVLERPEVVRFLYRPSNK